MEGLAVAAGLLLGSCASAQSAAPSQFVPLVPRWSEALSAPPGAPPVISGNTIIVALPGEVLAFRASDGGDVWRSRVPAGRSVSVDEARAYVASAAAIHALSLKTGDIEWHEETGTLTAPPLVHSGWVVVAAAGGIAAFRATDGSAVWRQAIGPIEHRPAIDGDLLFLPLVDQRLMALDLKTGEVRWQRQLGGRPGEPLAIGGKVYAGASDKFFYTLDASDGRIEWRSHVGAGPRGRAAADDDYIYFVAADNILRALDRGDGAREWAKRLMYRPREGPVRLSGAILVPGAVTALPVFGRDGASLTDITFPSTLVNVSNVVFGPWNYPMLGAVTGDLEHPWTLWFLEPSIEPPAIPLAALTALPGATIEIGMPR